jgi:dCMP deaminase
MRITWDRTWISIAKVMSLRSECTRSQVGAVIVNNKNRVIATGYNGPPANSTVGESCQLSCPRSHGDVVTGYGFSCISIHAEANALLFCDRSTIEGGSIYVTAVPCEDCSKMIANSGLSHVYFINDKKPNRPAAPIAKYLAQHGVTMKEITDVIG